MDKDEYGVDKGEPDYYAPFFVVLWVIIVLVIYFGKY